MPLQDFQNVIAAARAPVMAAAYAKERHELTLHVRAAEARRLDWASVERARRSVAPNDRVILRLHDDSGGGRRDDWRVLFSSLRGGHVVCDPEGLLRLAGAVRATADAVRDTLIGQVAEIAYHPASRVLWVRAADGAFCPAFEQSVKAAAYFTTHEAGWDEPVVKIARVTAPAGCVPLYQASREELSAWARARAQEARRAPVRAPALQDS